MKSCLTKIAVLMFIFILPCDAGFADDTGTNYACDVTPTVRSAASGNWNDPNVWDTGKVPDKGDWVLVNPEHTITLPNAVDLDNGGICNKGVMQSSANILDNPATRIEIRAAAVQNSGEISGQNGKDGVCSYTSYCEKYNICDLATYDKQSSLLPNNLPIPPKIRACRLFSRRFCFITTPASWFKSKNISINQHPTSGSSIQINSKRFVNDAVGKILSGNGGNDVQTCRDRAWSRAGDGGNIEIISPVFINEGLIESGKGGYAQSYHTTSKGGNGGNLLVLSDVGNSDPAPAPADTSLRFRRSKRDDNQPSCGNCASDSYTSDSRNSGCCVAGDGGTAQTQAGLGSSGKGGDIALFLQELGGKISGKSGSVFSWDPINIKASDCLKVQNFDLISLFTDPGGTIDLTRLQEGAVSGKVITIITKALNGQGGTIDLRGIDYKALKADDAIKFFTEQLLMNNGISLAEITDSPDIEVLPGKTVNQILWSGEQNITGKAGTVVSIPLTLINISSSADIYTLSIKDSAGWSFGTFPSEITLEGFKAAKLTLDMTIPENADRNDVITITAVSQRDPAISASIEIRISIPGIDADEDNSKAGVFKVDDTGIVKIDWLYDGGKYQGEFGIFSLTGMDNLTPGSPEFIAEAVKRVMSNSEQGYLVFSDLSEGARFSGLLGGEIRDWNAGPYKGLKSLTMNAGDQFATILVPNSTFASLAQNPATTDTNKRPLFSLVSENEDYGMYIGQMTDINGMGKAFAYEDKDAATSDWDFNDLIIQITGANTVLPTIDELKAEYDDEQQTRSKRDSDWRTSDLGRLILEHIETPAPTADTISMSVILKAPAILLVYDPNGKVIGKEGGTIPGADFEISADGSQTVTLNSLNPGSYRITVQTAAPAQGMLTVRSYQGSAEISSADVAVGLAAHQTMTMAVPADSVSASQPLSLGTPVTATSYDFSGDGITDNADVSMIVKHWNSCRNQQKYDPFYDLNDDGCITVADVMKVLNAKTVK